MSRRKAQPARQPLASLFEHLAKLRLEGNHGEAAPEWDEAFEAWFAERYPEVRWSSDRLGLAWMKHAAMSAILWTSGMLPEDDTVFDK